MYWQEAFVHRVDWILPDVFPGQEIQWCLLFMNILGLRNSVLILLNESQTRV